MTQVLENFTYVRETADPDGRDHAFVFTASVAGKKLQGCDFLHLDKDGKIDDFTVMARPLSAAHTLSEAMGTQINKITRQTAEQ